MTYRPKHNRLQSGCVMCACLIVFSLSLFVGAYFGGAVNRIAIAVAIVLIALTGYIAARYYVPDMLYVIDPDGIKVYRIRYGKSEMLANVPLYDCILLADCKSYTRYAKELGKISAKYSYTQNIFSQDKRVLFFDCAGSRYAMTLEGGKSFFDSVLSVIPSKEV